MSAPNDKFTWPDISHYGLHLGRMELPSGEPVLVLIDDNRRYGNIAANMGFKATRWPGVHVRQNIKINVAQLRGVFPKVRLQETTVADLQRLAASKIAALATDGRSLSASVALRQATYLGRNADGHAVYEGATGRFVKPSDDAEKVELDTGKDPAKFLRAPDDKALAECAQALAREILDGHILRSEDIARFMGALTAPSEPTPEFTWKANRAIDFALSLTLRARSQSADAGAFALALRLHEGQVSRTAGEGRMMTPLPVAVAMQQVLSAGTEIAGKKIHAIESFAGEHTALIDSVVQRADKGYDHVIAGLYGEEMERPATVAGVRFQRSDYAAIASALEGREAKGRGVFVLAAEKAGKVEPGFRRFLDYLYRHYKVEEVVDIDPAMVGLGSRMATRFITVGDRLEAPALDAQIPTAIDVFHDYPAFWERMENLSARLSGVPGEEIDSLKARLENQFQAPYIPTSQSGEPSLMAPRNLIGPMRQALAHLEEEEGMTVDEFVASRLDWSAAELTKHLAPEQVDAVALAIQQVERGRATVEADQTGVGKGRVLAAMARYHRLRGEPVVFVTKTADLFQDFYRDIEDIGSLDLFRKPFILNAGVEIVDSSGAMIGRTPNRETMESFLRGTLENVDLDIVMLTYSQINREAPTAIVTKAEADARNAELVKEGKSPVVKPTQLGEVRSAWFANGGLRGANLLLDESHEAAGRDSNTGENVRAALDHAASVVHSSATFAKNALSMMVYRRAFPDSLDISSLDEVLELGGEPLQEALSAELAKDGVLVRREHDLSMLDFKTYIDNPNSERNREVSDRVSEVLAGMCYLSGEVGKIIGGMNKDLRVALANAKQKSPNASIANTRYTHLGFGSRVYLLMRQFLMAIKADAVADLAIEALKNGQKPVIAFETTMESALRRIAFDEQLRVAADAEALKDDEEALDALEELEEHADDPDTPAADSEEGAQAPALDPLALAAPESMSDVVLKKPISFREILKASCETLFKVKKHKGGRKGAQQVTTLTIDKPELQEGLEALKKLIDKLPDVPASPIDVIKDRIRAAGFTVDEISGRQLCLATEADAKGRERHIVRKLRKGDKTSVKNAFNNGATDALLVSRSGGTGNSLHASGTYLDQRRRHLIELQAAADVAARIQMFGRVNRKGQVCPPIITQVSSALPAENRLIMVQNEQLRKLSANVTSNRESAANNDAVPDILNRLGNEVVYRFLENNPDVAKRVGVEPIPLEIANETKGYTYFVDKLTARVALLPVAEQERCYAEIATEYRALLAEMDARGANYIKPKEYDIRARTIDREVLLDFAQAPAGEEVPLGQEKPAPAKRTSVFDAPVMRREIEYDITMTPIKGEEVLALMKKAREELAADARVSKTFRERGRWDRNIAFNGSNCYLSGLWKAVHDGRKARLEAAVPERFATVEEALTASDRNIVKTLDARMAYMMNLYTNIRPGCGLVFSSSAMQGPRYGVIVDLKLPAEGAEHLPGQLEIKVAIPGEERLTTLTGSELQSDPRLSITDPDEGMIKRRFDEHPAGTYTYRRSVLDGNLFRAVQSAMELGCGTIAVYTDEAGIRHRGVVMPQDAKVKEMLRPPVDTDLGFELLDSGEINKIFTSPGATWGECVEILATSKGHTLVFPGKERQRMEGCQPVLECLGEISKTRLLITADIRAGKLKDLMQALSQHPFRFKFYADPGSHKRVMTKRAENANQGSLDLKREPEKPDLDEAGPGRRLKRAA